MRMAEAHLDALAAGYFPPDEPEMDPGEVYALAHEADVAAQTVDAAHAGGQFVGDGDALRRAWQDRAMRHAARTGVSTPRAA